MVDKNTVVIDLDRYDEMVALTSYLKNELSEYENMVANKMLLSIDRFCIEKNDDGNFELFIDVEGIKQIVDTIGGYSVATNWNNKLRIGSYQLKITEEEI